MRSINASPMTQLCAMSSRGLLLACACSWGLLWAETPSPVPLFEAIRRGDPAAVHRLLNRGLSANTQDTDGTPALMAAAMYAGADCVKLLLDRGANPNARNASGATALMWALPDIAKTKLLIAAGADVNAQSTNLQRTPFLIAASYPRAAA